jgi:cytochrome c553
MLNKKLLFIPAILLTTLSVSVIADDDKHYGFGFFSRSKQDVKPVENSQYKTECGSCHFAYQPGLLPARSWEKMMQATALENHFGENAELLNEDRVAISQYLVDNAADKIDFGRSGSFSKSVKSNEAPLRITETRYFKRKHHELPDRIVTQNKLVGSYSACAKCHTKAETGSYDEHQVKIPGYGRWDD